MRLPHQFMRRLVGDEPAVVDDGDPVAKLLRLFQIMGGEHHGDTALVQLPDIGPELLAQFDVDTGGRLVQHQHRRRVDRSEEHTSELQSLMRISYAVFCLKKKSNSSRTIT